jgi:hypothetical protein
MPGHALSCIFHDGTIVKTMLRIQLIEENGEPH